MLLSGDAKVGFACELEDRKRFKLRRRSFGGEVHPL